MAHRPVSEEEVAIFKDCFSEYDKNGSGTISVKEFGAVYRLNNQDVSDTELAKIVAEVDNDGDGNIDFEEFVLMMTGGRSIKHAQRATPKVVVSPPSVGDENEREYEAAWKEFDPTLKSSITASQFRQALAGLGLEVSDTKLSEIVNSVDDEDKLTFHKFIRYIRSQEEEP